MSADLNPPWEEEPLGSAELMARLYEDPVFTAKMRKSYEDVLALPLTPATEQLHQVARTGLALMRHYRGAMRCAQALRQLIAAVSAPGCAGDMDRVRSLLALADEAVDHLLDVREPDRTHLMAPLLCLRDNLRQMLERG